MIAIKGFVRCARDLSEKADYPAGAEILAAEFAVVTSGPPLGVRSLQDLLESAEGADVVITIEFRRK